MAETYSAGVVTAYGAAVRGGYTGTYEEFCAEQAEFGRNAAAVAQAKADVETMQGQVEQAAATFVDTTVPAAVTTVQEAGAAQVQAVQTEGTTQAAAVETVGAQQKNAVEDAGSDAVDAVETAETAATDAVTAAQTAAVQAVQTESTTQQAAIQTKGQETIASIPEDYTALSGEVDDLKRAIISVGDEIKPLYTNYLEQGKYTVTAWNAPLRADSSTYTVRTPDFYPWSANKVVEVKSPFVVRIDLCDASGNVLTETSWLEKCTSDNSTATKCKVQIKKSSSVDITPEDALKAIVRTDIPFIEIEPKVNVSDFEDSIDVLEETKASAFVYNNFPLTLESNIYTKWGNTVETGVHASVTVAEGERYFFCGYKWGADYPAYLFRKNGSLVSYYTGTSGNGLENSWEIIVPSGVDELILNSHASYPTTLAKAKVVDAMPFSKWEGKKIAWFGTSIPETNNYNAVIGYPEYVGKLLGATVYNEAVGSSCARRGFKTAESADDPYGWTGMGVAALWNMGSTVAEKNEIITNWESKWRALTGYDYAMTTAISNKAIACSYENKLIAKYITDNPCDLYVFDHGYNDWKSGDLDANPNDAFDRSTFQGAMNTFIKAIMESRQRTRIVILSHYEDQERAGLVEMQNNEAKYWNLPFCKIYEKLGWANDRQITTTGYWTSNNSNKRWIESGGESQTISLKQYHIPDGRHPNGDVSGHACMDIAHIIADFLNTITPAMDV